MQDIFRIRPARPDARVLDPGTGALLPYYETGVERPRSPHWLRQIAHGDVIEVAAAHTAPPPVPAPEAASDEPAPKSRRKG
jgi:hypothetical protein